MDYDIISMALNRVVESGNYVKETESLRKYVNDPSLKVPSYISEHCKILIQVGRERPMYFIKLMDMVEQIRMGTGDPALYDEAQWRAVDEALDLLYERDRPTRLIDAIKDAANSDLPWKSALQKSDLKPFSPLVKLYRGSPKKFEEFIKLREYIRLDTLRTNLNARRKDLRDRRMKLSVLVQFKNKWFEPAMVAHEVDDRLKAAMEARHVWVKRRNKGVTSVESSNEYWKLYDEQLDDALAMVERARKGAFVIAKEVKYPRVKLE